MGVISLVSVQNNISRLLSLTLCGGCFTNIGKFLYPLFGSDIKKINNETISILKYLGRNCDIKRIECPFTVIAQSLKWLCPRIKNGPADLKCVQIKTLKTYIFDDYQHPRFNLVNKLCAYIEKQLKPYLVDAYLHGSLSTLDCTEFSDLDTLFIIKKDILENPEKIRDLQKSFINSLTYLYGFDPLQHHCHFFLTECDLSFYNQSFLPISAIELSTSILGTGRHLRFFIRDAKLESEERFLKSVKIVLRYANDADTLEKPYLFKGMLSHFMILPALFLQLKGNYVSKRASFDIVKEKIPTQLWLTMEKVSSLRQNWSQKPAFYAKGLYRVLGSYNPLLLSHLARHVSRPSILRKNRIAPELLAEIDIFTRYILHESGLDENRFEN
jgi:hypothetical protein